jgi:16S rRNA U516 pseudouridylate synthase RsuA-like enzyme
MKGNRENVEAHNMRLWIELKEMERNVGMRLASSFGTRGLFFSDVMFQTKDVYLLRKPAGIPTTRGKEPCFLDLFAEGSVDMDRWITDFPHFIDGFEQIRAMGWYELTNPWEARQWLLEEFSMREEYGLLNRLDTDTSGYLYFARSRDVYKQRRDWQRDDKVQKWYLAQVEGDVRRDALQASESGRGGYYPPKNNETIKIAFPIMHHKHEERMVSCVNNDGMERMMRRGRGKVLEAESRVNSVFYDPEANTSVVRVMITHGWRHQIRIHLAMLGNPIVGDALYWNGREGDILQLVSCGCSVERK